MSSVLVIVLCSLFTMILFFYVFYTEDEVWVGEEKTQLGYLYERKEVIYDNLRDLNFEYKAGKFPDGDFQAMRSTLEAEAAQVLAEIELLENAPSVAPAVPVKSRKGARS
ncbi:MAG: hypothetical protein WA188_00650 [Terriglobales bacterium]